MLLSFTYLHISFDWSGISTSDHVLLDRWLWIQVSVHVGPSLVLGDLVDLGLVAVLLRHLGLLVREVDLVVEEVLRVGQILHGPGLLFGFLVLRNGLVVFDLLCASSIDLVD